MSKSGRRPTRALINLLDDPKVIGEEDPLGGHRQRARDPLRRETKPGVSNLLTIQSALTGRSSTTSRRVTRARATAI